ELQDAGAGLGQRAAAARLADGAVNVQGTGVGGDPRVAGEGDRAGPGVDAADVFQRAGSAAGARAGDGERLHRKRVRVRAGNRANGSAVLELQCRTADD